MSLIVKQLLSDARKGLISKDKLLVKCLEMLDQSSSEDLYKMALDEGFINTQSDADEIIDDEFNKLDTTQRIIEKVLSRHGE